MLIKDLDLRVKNPDVLLMVTNSSRLEEFIRDKMKRYYHISSESIIEIDTKESIKQLKSIQGVAPMFSDKWFISINLDKFDVNFCKTIVDTIESSPTCFFFISGTYYATYKNCKNMIEEKKDIILYDYYLKSLKKSDFLYLYDAFVSDKYKLTSSLFKYVYNNYNSNIDAYFTLLLRLNEGVTVNNPKDIVDICGLGGLSTESYILKLVKPLSGSDKGLRTVIRNKVKEGKELGDVYGYDKFYRFINKNIEVFCEIKMLTISGVIYRKIENLPKGYDETKLLRYNKYLPSLSNVPLSELLRLKKAIGTRVWRTELDFMNFLYNYYDVKGKIKLMKGI